MRPVVSGRGALVRHRMVMLRAGVVGVTRMLHMVGMRRLPVCQRAHCNRAVDRMLRTRVQARRLSHHQGEPGSEKCRERATGH